ncbi:telomeric repeat-binding factor 2-interacting protein 1 isoform X2 [Nerophis lumbriciformis]|uniref:telomeric repeat-binding factor 2-interacting protein 1 isoform X2 n=1 Tax=Nerophis lumbriciformis TaxID=546530 RepID=UPI002ADF80F4|nr:telomeric repeat-binding factor 2-interacting protein 1-like isoform X2 [Nerophis lumbriciformis]
MKMASNISPVLFVDMGGNPMSFYLRPGPTKKELQPLIKAGGGIACNILVPGSILLIDPKDQGTISPRVLHRYVSIKYVHDCMKKGQQLNIEDYRLNPENVSQGSASRSNETNRRSAAASGGRLGYSADEDAAILSYVSQRKSEVKGNSLWKQMEKEEVTNHTWQSMKSRYQQKLSSKQSEAEEVETPGEVTKGDGEAEGTGNSPGEVDDDPPLPQMHADPENPREIPSSDDLTQIEDLHNEYKQLSAEESPQQEEEKPPAHKCVQATTGTAEKEKRDSSQTKEIIDPEDDQSQEFLQTVNYSDDTEPSQSKPQSDTLYLTDTDEEDGQLHLPMRRARCRRLELEAEPYNKKFQSSSSSAALAPSPLTPSPRRTRSATSTSQKDTVEEPPTKKAKEIAEAAESQKKEEDHLIHEECKSVQEKKKEKVLGILAKAAREFESSDSESTEEHFHTASEQPYVLTAIAASIAASAVTDQSDPDLFEQGPSAQETSREAEPALEPICAEAATVASKAHTFILEGVSHEEDAARPDPIEEEAESLSQAHLEEDKQRITELMNLTNKDLMAVTLALLKTSGDFLAASRLLLDPSSISGPFWDPRDDSLLLSEDPAAHQQLQKKYSDVDLAKRMLFLELRR